MLLDATESANYLAFFGRTHPLILHLPLGLVPGLALLEFGAAMLRRELPRGPILTLAWLCALSAALATASGLVLASEGGFEGDTIGNHKIAGIALGVICLLLAIASCLRRRGPFRILLLLALIVMIPTGHLGGSLTHGANFLFAPFDRSPQNGDNTDNGNGDNDPPAATEFERTIAPILERTCYKCHNPEKTKGELLLTTVEGIRQGGDNGPVLVPYKPDESELLVRCELPLDDDDHMPPEGKPQPTAEELATLRAWIAAGASFE